MVENPTVFRVKESESLTFISEVKQDLNDYYILVQLLVRPNINGVRVGFRDSFCRTV